MKDKIKNLPSYFHVTKDKQISREININNVNMMHRMALIVVIMEAIILSVFLSHVQIGRSILRTIMSLIFCIVICLIVYFITGYLKKTRKDREFIISDFQVNAFGTIFYVLMSIWAMYSDYTHYINQQQMFTFFIVQFSFMIFLVWQPRFSQIAIWFTYILFYALLFRADGAVSITTENYFALAFITAVAALVRYREAVIEERDYLKVTELNHMLQDFAQTDELTELKNRYSLRIDFPSYVDKDLLVMMADIDHFKSFNDTYGHLMGDEVLKRVATAFRGSFGQNSCYRYGGDEFLVILPLPGKEEQDKILKAWEKEISKIIIAGIPEEIMCSYGIVTGSPLSTEECRQLINNADAKLYEAKKKKAVGR